jgi:hypothetical protein
MVRLSTAGDVV